MSNALDKIQRRLKVMAERLEKIDDTLADHERRCADCEERIEAKDTAHCESCSTVYCESCKRRVSTEALCWDCHSAAVESANSGAHTYPHLGIPPGGCLEDRLLLFLSLIPATCCRAEPKPCARCADARELFAAYKTQLGEVRA